MEVRPLPVPGAWEVLTETHRDPRGSFLEWFRADLLAEATGVTFGVAQANLSTSGRGVVRGLHVVRLPPGQAKYVTCVAGEVLDVVADPRPGSPAFGTWTAVRLDDRERRAVLLETGLAHGFAVLSDEATLAYLCSTTYAPAAEVTVNPMDPSLAVRWPVASPALLPRDADAPTLADAVARGLLPDYSSCRSRRA